MNASELSDALRIIGWTDVDLARKYGCSQQFVHRCKRGQARVPKLMAELVQETKAAIKKFGQDMVTMK